VDRVVADVSRETLVTGIVDNLSAVFVDLLTRLPDGERFTVGDATGYFTDIPFPVFNGVVGPRFSTETVDDGIDAFIDHARMRQVPMLWQLTPSSQPENLGVRLEAHGFQRSLLVPGMAIDLGTLTAEDSTPGLSIELVRDPSAVRLAASLLCRCFAMPSWLEEPWLRILSIAGLDDEAMFQTYLARLAGEPVGVSSVGYAAGIAGIYNVGTLEAYRGKGIGRALTRAPLLDAHQRGYRVGILHASETGFPVYRRMGFQQYCEIHYYVWMNDSVHDQSTSGTVSE
jgi:ribosomal protein S18 acetylase RimI-like enzyme